MSRRFSPPACLTVARFGELAVGRRGHAYVCEEVGAGDERLPSGPMSRSPRARWRRVSPRLDHAQEAGRRATTDFLESGLAAHWGDSFDKLVLSERLREGAI
jgi:hypothetical protein